MVNQPHTNQLVVHSKTKENALLDTCYLLYAFVGLITSEQLLQVNEHEYLGVVFDRNGRIDQEMSKHVRKADSIQ